MAEAPAKKIGEVQLKNVRLSFEHLFVPTASVANGALKYRSSFLMDPNDADGKRNIAACRKAMAEAEQETFKRTGVQYKDDRCAFKDGDACVSERTGEVYDGYAGMMVVSSANARRPPVVDRNPSVALSRDDGRPYSGCYVNALIRFYGVKGADKGGNGLFASLEAVQFVRDGEAFGAAPVDAESVFGQVEGEDGFDGDDGIG
jgi:hypothetical protein